MHGIHTLLTAADPGSSGGDVSELCAILFLYDDWVLLCAAQAIAHAFITMLL